jgi:hypothetical protein
MTARDRDSVADLLRLASSVGIVALLVWRAVQAFGAW